MRINCPGCGGILPFSEQQRGKKIRCGKCSTVVSVPSAAEVVPVVTATPVVPSPVVKPAPVVVPAQPVPQSPSSPRSQAPSPQSAFTAIPSPTQTPYPRHPKKKPSKSVSNRALAVTAVCCVGGLLLLIGAGLAMNHLANKSPEAAVVDDDEAVSDVVNDKVDDKETKAQAKPVTIAEVPTPAESGTAKVDFQEGYTMLLPTEFAQQSREETPLGDIVYRFRTEKGYKFILAILHGESADRLAQPPASFAKTVVRSIDGLDEFYGVQIQPQRESVGGMAANVFHFAQRETFRDVNFVYVMAAMDHGKKIVMKFSGKYGGYSSQEENITMPNHWHRSLRSFRRSLPAR